MNVRATSQVPLLDLKAQYSAIKPEIDAAIAQVVEGQGFILGPEVSALERQIVEYSHVAEGIACASGSDAILLALMALKVEPGDEVICPSYTFFATAGAVARLGAVPVFADIDPSSYNVNPQSIRVAAASCRRLKAILPVHLYGRCADMFGIMSVAGELGVPVIEDAAQAIGSEDAVGRRAGSIGAVGCFSFFPSKNLGCYGDGGMSVTNDASLAEAMRILRVHGSKPKYYHKIVGLNSRLDAIQAAILRVKLRHLDNWTAARQRHARFLDSVFIGAGALTSDIPLSDGQFPLRTPFLGDGSERHVYNQYVVRVPAASRDPLKDHLRNMGIGTEIYYPLPLHLQECFAQLGYREGSLPQSEAAAKETLALPIYPELNQSQLEYVAGTVIAFLRSAAARVKLT